MPAMFIQVIDHQLAKSGLPVADLLESVSGVLAIISSQFENLVSLHGRAGVCTM